ncbi:MAG: Asp-tRNA(Asn)/Glu-tRNA(Gln) amidotransferase subunit GatC [Saccharofermentanales bacterium]
MEISKKMIEYLAALSKVKVNPEQEEKIGHDLEEILDYMKILNEADISGIEPMSHTFTDSDSFREDECLPYPDPGVLTTAAPESKNNCYKVPRTVE